VEPSPADACCLGCTDDDDDDDDDDECGGVTGGLDAGEAREATILAAVTGPVGAAGGGACVTGGVDEAPGADSTVKPEAEVEPERAEIGGGGGTLGPKVEVDFFCDRLFCDEDDDDEPDDGTDEALESPDVSMS